LNRREQKERKVQTLRPAAPPP